MLVEELADHRRPDLDGVWRINEEMSVAAKRRQQVIFGIAASTGVGLVHPLRQSGTEERVVLDVEPKHRHPRRTSEIPRCSDEFVGRAIVVRLAADAPAATSSESNDRLYVWQ